MFSRLFHPFSFFGELYGFSAWAGLEKRGFSVGKNGESIVLGEEENGKVGEQRFVF